MDVAAADRNGVGMIKPEVNNEIGEKFQESGTNSGTKAKEMLA
jgi:hypothetical protein